VLSNGPQSSYNPKHELHFSPAVTVGGVRVVPSIPSKEKFLDLAAYASLFLTVATILWPKFAELVEMVARDLNRWVRHLAPVIALIMRTG
jgi:hypothetical protein